MASPRTAPVADFVRSLYELGGFTSWGEFARESGFLASTISDWQLGKNAPSGPNLVRLIQTATDRAPLAMREAAERTSPMARVHDRLQALEAAVAELATAADVETGFRSLVAAIEQQGTRRTRAASQKRKAG
jgi:hypothetical protein